MTSLRLKLKSLVRGLGNRARFPRAQIGSLTYLSEGCAVAAGAIVGRDCHLFQTSLDATTVVGDKVIVGAGSRVGGSSLGHGCIVESQVEIFNSTLADFVSVHTKSVLNQTRVGRNSYLAREACLNDVTIGGFSSIGPQTLLGCGDHPTHFISTAPVFYSTRRQCGTTFATKDHFVERKTIVLGHDVWIGARVFVRDGVTIGDGAIVAAGSVVVKDVAPYAIVGGTPAKILRLRFSEADIARLLKLQWWNWDEARLRAAQPWFAQEDIGAFLRHAES